jgi:hypothetical protein
VQGFEKNGSRESLEEGCQKVHSGRRFPMDEVWQRNPDRLSKIIVQKG